MLTPLLILCTIVWFVALVFVWSAIDKYLLDTGQQALRDNAAMLTANNKPTLAALAASELQTYAPSHYAAYAVTGTLATFIMAFVSILFVSRWRSKLSPLTGVAVGVTTSFLCVLTLQAWTCLSDSRRVEWVCFDVAMLAITLVLVLAAGVLEKQV